MPQVYCCSVDGLTSQSPQFQRVLSSRIQNLGFITLNPKRESRTSGQGLACQGAW